MFCNSVFVVFACLLSLCFLIDLLCLGLLCVLFCGVVMFVLFGVCWCVFACLFVVLICLLSILCLFGLFVVLYTFSLFCCA